MEYLEKLKFIAYTILAWVLAVVSNIKDVIIVLGIIFIINIVAGVSTALNKKKETFSIWKFFEAFELLMFYLSIVAFLSVTGRCFNDRLISEEAVKWLTYIVSWGYLINIFKNAKILFPNQKTLEIIYLFLSTEILIMIKNKLGVNKDANNR